MGAPTRDAFGETLLELGKKDPRIVVVDGDVADSTRTKEFFNEFPDRAWNVGIAESNLVGIGAGLAASGKIPLIASFACFLLCNAYEDVALACGLGGFTVVVPSDAASTRALTKAMFEHVGPVYMRTGRPDAPVIYEEEPKVSLGKSILVRDGKDLTIIANGLMVAEALDAADQLGDEGTDVRVIDMHTVKPSDEEAIERAATETQGIVVAEEHFSHGALGAAVSMVVGSRHPVKMAFVNVGDRYSTSGKPAELFKDAGITSANIAKAARSL
jgi:transketolase